MTNGINFTVRELIEDLQLEMKAGFDGVNSRLDQQNGRIRANELHIALNQGRDRIVAAVAGIVGGIAVSVIAALLLGVL